MREATRRIQQLRKEAGLEKQQDIELAVETELDFLEEFEDEIKETVGAVSFEVADSFTSDYDYSREDEVKGENFKVMFNVL